MPDPYELPGITVVGQRRQPGGGFPSGGGGGANNPGGPTQIELNPADPPPEPETQSNPCEDPVGKLIWNADAAAAAAIAAFVARSNALGDGGSLTNREYGANLVRSTSGGVTITSVDHGDPIQPGVTPSVTITGAATYLNWMGDIHNHPSGDGRPSAGEWQTFIARVDAIVANHPERAAEMAHASAYIVVGTPPNQKIYAYNRNSDPDSLGQEVNPDAQPCPQV